MMNIGSFFHINNLQKRLILWFLLISLLPVAWIAFISYEFSKRMLLNQASQNLETISLLQSQDVEEYFEEKQKDLSTFAKSLIVPTTIKELERASQNYGKNSPEYEKIDQQFRSILSLRAESLGYSNLFLIDTEGQIVFALFPREANGVNIFDDIKPYHALSTIFENTRNFSEIAISNFISYNSQDAPTAFVAAPILDPLFIGVVIAQLDNSSIYKLLTDYTGLNETGEIILVTKMDDKLISIGPLRHSKNKEPMQVISPNTPFGNFILRTLDGERLTLALPDYRGQESLMVGRYFLPGFNWGIITKIDLNELLQPINKLKLLSLLMALTTAAIVIITASNVAKAISSPILNLIKKTKLMASGDLSQRIKVETPDEFGRLAKSFNDMASQLDSLVRNLDTIVSKRTEELETQNLQLEHTVEELQQAQNRLINQEKLASLGALTAGIAHEIKNPLNFINNFAELSLQIDREIQEHIEKVQTQIGSEETEELKDLLNTLLTNISKIYEHGKRADAIIRNMLQHSRGAPGEKMLVDLNVLLDEYVALSYHGMRAQDLAFNAKIEKDYDNNLPKISVVPQDISRVFLNLLNNAYYSVLQKKKQLGEEYTPIVKVTTGVSEDFITIKIWDNGLGIPNEIFPKLFTPFFTTKPTGEGTGLGLSLSYNIIVQGHNGNLIADSEPGEFAEFIIHFPIEK